MVRDDGCGMTLESGAKSLDESSHADKVPGRRGAGRDGLTPERKRVVQGRKGYRTFRGASSWRKRYASVTRPPVCAVEIRLTVVWYDFTRFDDDFVTENGKEKEIFLDEVKVEWWERTPKALRGRTHGTVIELDALKGAWSERLIKFLCQDVANLTDPVSRLTRKEATDSFEIGVVCNGERRIIAHDEEETLKSLIEDKRVFSIEGGFSSKDCLYRFDKGNEEEEISLFGERVMGLWIWRQRYRNKEDRKRASIRQTYVCGDFRFQFYIFDFARGIEGRYQLAQPAKDLLKAHRIYLYRDGVRVYPYGDPDDDWLNIDVTRGTGRAGDFFSNDQIIGWVDITQEGNPRLRDKTNREGLIETGGAAHDFVFLIQTFLSYVKQYPFGRYQQKQRRRNLAKSAREGLVAKHLSALKAALTEAGEAARARDVSKIETDYRQERDFLSRRAEMTEDLAGVGLSVEMASHDIMLLMGRARDIGLKLAQNARKGSTEAVREQADMLVGVLQQIVTGMRDVQSLFRSSRRRRQVLKVEPILDKIQAIYASLLEKLEITYSKSVVGTSPLVASATDGVVMQVLINLFDNAAYWLETRGPLAPREIRVTLDGDSGELIFADSGPGVDIEDRSYIFEPFFSGKGQEGRGLGLYIARQLLERYGYAIDLQDSGGSLGGAGFVVRFVRDEG